MQAAVNGGDPGTRDSAREMHALREQLLDPLTTRRLSGLGVRKGWRCLEVGAGSGSIARWLARKVGRKGKVVATELYPQHLDDLSEENVKVREHDLRTGGFEKQAYHLVHCRAVLMHLPKPGQALATLVAALRPGGRLLLEEADLGSFGAADLRHAKAASFNRVSRLLTETFRNAGIMDPYVGRRLRALVERFELTHLEQDGVTWVHRGGEDAARFMQSGFRDLMRDPRAAPWLVGETELTAFDETFSDASFHFVNFTLFGVSGRTPK
jgi:protein-L-isoaspartate O-methyltransferase